MRLLEWSTRASLAALALAATTLLAAARDRGAWVEVIALVISAVEAHAFVPRRARHAHSSGTRCMGVSQSLTTASTTAE